VNSCLTPLDAPHDEGVEGWKKPLLIVEEDASVTMKGWAGYVRDIIGLTGELPTSRTAHNSPKRKEVTNDRRAFPPRSHSSTTPSIFNVDVDAFQGSCNP